MSSRLLTFDWAARIATPPAQAVPDSGGLWWVAHTRPRNEKALVLALTTGGVYGYLPLAQRVTRSRATGRASRSIAPVFTGYVFVMLATEDDRRRVLATDRVANLIRVLDQRGLVRELRHIQHVLALRTPFDWGPKLEQGDWARVLSGPLAGVEGVVVRPARGARLALNVRMLSQSVIVDVARESLEKIDAPA
jgi:transcription antitermination factor NusG